MKKMLTLFGFHCAILVGQVDAEIVQNTYSADRHYAIEEANGDCYFVEVTTKQRLGNVIPPNLKGKISNIEISQARWNKEGTNVAVVIYYGTKMGGVFLYSRNKSGSYDPLKISLPDPIEVFIGLDEKWRKFKSAPGYDEYYLGSWTGEAEVNVLVGNSKELPGERRHFFLSTKLWIRGHTVVIKEAVATGALVDKDKAKFLSAWKK